MLRRSSVSGRQHTMDCRADRRSGRGIWQVCGPRRLPRRPEGPSMPRLAPWCPHPRRHHVRARRRQSIPARLLLRPVGQRDGTAGRGCPDGPGAGPRHTHVRFRHGCGGHCVPGAAASCHIVAPTAMYWGLRQWLTEDAPGHGIEATFVDAGDPDALRAAIRPGRTRLVWIETPSNPLWTVTDIAEAAHIAHAAGALLAVDSTVPTPVLSQPIGLGADLVLHSATKYLNGHSDVIAGADRVCRKRHSIGMRGPAAHHAGRHPRLVRSRPAVAGHAHAARARTSPVRVGHGHRHAFL